MRQKIPWRGEAHALQQLPAECLRFRQAHVKTCRCASTILSSAQMTEEIEMLEHHTPARFGRARARLLQGPARAAAHPDFP